MKLFLSVVVVLVCMPCFALSSVDAITHAAIQSEDRQQRLQAAAREYVSAVSTQLEESKWLARWKDRLQSAEAEQEGHENYTKRVVRTFFEDRAASIEKPEDIPDQDLLQACRYYLLCRTGNIPVPARLESRLTDDVTQKIVRHLEIRRNALTGQSVAAPAGQTPK